LICPNPPASVDQLALAGRPQSFRRMMSWSSSRSSVRFATIFFRRPFIFQCLQPSHLVGQKGCIFLAPVEVSRLAASDFRQISAIGTSSSLSFKINAFWASKKFDAFVDSAPVPSLKFSAENFNQKRPSFWGSEQRGDRHHAFTFRGRADYRDFEVAGERLEDGRCLPQARHI
jgi:hypothetical protein